MKWILTTITLIGMASQLHAATASDLIQQMRGERHSQRSMKHQKVPSQARHTEHWTPRHTVKQAVHKTHQKAERKLAHTAPIRRHFRTIKEFQKLERRQALSDQHRMRPAARHVRKQHHALPVATQRHNRYLGNGWYEDEHGQYDEQYSDTQTQQAWRPRMRHHRQHAYHHYRRQWYLTYLYERADFYDRHGYHYGRFNERGFVFEGVFYRYDRAYTYQDRLHGKDLFAHRFYRPSQRYAYQRDRWQSGNGAGFYFTWSL